MKKTALALAIILALLFLTVAGSPSAKTAYGNPSSMLEPLPDISIRSNGDIAPGITWIKRVGDVYTLTKDVSKYAISVYRDNITIDGGGHQIDCGGTLQGPGLYLSSVGNVTVRNMAINRFNIGVYVSDSKNCIIERINLTNNGSGISLYSSEYNNITENNIDHNDWGINVHTSCCNNIFGNNIILNYEKGIVVLNSQENKVYANNITNNNVGMHIETQKTYKSPLTINNLIYLNNFINNTQQVYFHYGFYYIYDAPYPNYWDTNERGNYWSNYNGTDLNWDGVGDTPYNLDANNTDYYPLMKPFVLAESSNEGNITTSPELQQSEPFPTAYSIGIVAVIVLILLGSIVYILKRK